MQTDVRCCTKIRGKKPDKIGAAPSCLCVDLRSCVARGFFCSQQMGTISVSVQWWTKLLYQELRSRSCSVLQHQSSHRDHKVWACRKARRNPKWSKRSGTRCWRCRGRGTTRFWRNDGDGSGGRRCLRATTTSTVLKRDDANWRSERSGRRPRKNGGRRKSWPSCQRHGRRGRKRLRR